VLYLYCTHFWLILSLKYLKIHLYRKVSKNNFSQMIRSYFLMPFSSLVTIVVHTGFSLSAALLRIDSYRSCNKRSFLGYTYISTKNNHTYLDLVIVEGRRHAQNGKKIRTPRQSIYPVLVSVFFSVLSRSSHFRSDYHNHSSKTFSVPIYY